MANRRRPIAQATEPAESKMSTTSVNDHPGEPVAAQRQTAVTRREVLKASAGAALAVPLIVDRAAIAGRKGSEGGEQRKPLFFTPEEFSLVDELTELIIPADDHSPGARAAGVAAYIDFRLSESWEEEPKKRWRDGLKLVEALSIQMHGKGFLQSTVDQRIALLSAVSRNESKPETPEEKFFVELKSRTARAYYTSKIGIHSEMEYKGNTYLKEYAGYDAT